MNLANLLVVLFAITISISNLVFGDEELSYGRVMLPDLNPPEDIEIFCTAEKLREDKTYYIRTFDVINLYNAHHFMIYACEELHIYGEEWWDCSLTQAEGEGPVNVTTEWCKEGKGEMALYVETGEQPSFQLPDDVSFPVGAGTVFKYLVLQVHYKAGQRDVFNDPTVKDNSGIMYGYQTTPTPLLGGTLMMVRDGYILPNNKSPYGRDTADAVCKPGVVPEGQEIAIFGFRTHAHHNAILGTGFVIHDVNTIDSNPLEDGIRRGLGQPSRRRLTRRRTSRNPRFSKRMPNEAEDKEWSMISRIKEIEYNDIFRETEEDIVVTYRDTIAARCTYDNPTAENITMGTSKGEEMCIYYVMYYIVPSDNDDKDERRVRDKCIPGSTKVYWEEMSWYIGPVPEWVTILSINAEL